MTNLEDAFGETKSVPLEEALEDPEIEEFTDADLELINLGLDFDIFKHYKTQFPSKRAITNKKLPAKHFFVWYLERCVLTQLTQIEADKLPDTLQELVTKELEKNDVERYIKIIAERDEYISILENERAEMLSTFKKKSKEFKDIEFSGDQVQFTPGKDELFKKIAILQEERDKLKEGYITVNGEYLKWLYEFMSNMSFCDVDDIIRSLNASVVAGERSVSQGLVLKSIEDHMYTPTPKEIKQLQKIEEIVK